MAEELLSQKQQRVMAALLAGQTQREAARAAGVAEETVSRWKAKNAVFVAALNAGRSQVWEAHVERLRNLATQAMDAVADLLQSRSDVVRLRAAAMVLRANALCAVGPPQGHTEAAKVEREWQQNAYFEGLTSLLPPPPAVDGVCGEKKGWTGRR